MYEYEQNNAICFGHFITNTFKIVFLFSLPEMFPWKTLQGNFGRLVCPLWIEGAAYSGLLRLQLCLLLPIVFLTVNKLSGCC